MSMSNLSITDFNDPRNNPYVDARGDISPENILPYAWRLVNALNRFTAPAYTSFFSLALNLYRGNHDFPDGFSAIVDALDTRTIYFAQVFQMLPEISIV